MTIVKNHMMQNAGDSRDSATSDSSVDVKPPLDRFNLVYLLLLLHGIGFLLPWNVFINAREYFIDYKLNTTTSYDADYTINFMSYIGFAAFMPCLCFSAWNTFHRSTSSSSTTRTRFLGAMFVELAVLAFTIILALVDTSHVPGVFFALTIVSIVFINSCVGIHQTITFGMAAQFPMKYSNAVVIGSNACGTIIAVVNIVTKAIVSAEGQMDRTRVIGAVAYFGSAVLIVVACLVSYFWLTRLQYFRYYSRLSKGVSVTDSTSLDALREAGAPDRLASAPGGEGRREETGPGGDSPGGDAMGGDSAGGDATGGSPPASVSGNLETGDRPESQTLLLSSGRSNGVARKSGGESAWTVLHNCFGICCFAPPTGRQRCHTYWSRYLTCFSECYVHCISVWSVFFCSLSIFPAIQSSVKAVDPDYFIPPEWYTDVTCFLLFNLFAMLGCIVCGWIQFPGPRFLWIVVWLRTLFFIPFFLFCNVRVPEGRRRLPVLVANDHVYVFASVIFAFTNGYFSSLCMMYAPRKSPTERKELAGMLAAFFLIFGVFSGVYASRGFASIVMG